MLKQSITTLALASLALAAPAHATAIFSDSTFAGYVIGFQASQGSAVLSAAQCPSCGNPGSALQAIISNSDASNLGAAIINPSLVYVPQTQGAISGINVQVDKDLTVSAPPAYGFGNTVRLVIAQGGKFYTAVQFGTPVTVPAGGTGATSGYTTFTLSNLQATDFNQFDTSTGLVGTAHPDFNGPTITFGFGQVLAAADPATAAKETIESDFDNLTLTVLTGTAVPEPPAWLLMASALGLAGLLTTRRQTNRN